MKNMKDNICLNCGAEMRTRGFALVCDYCGNISIPSYITSIESIDSSSRDANSRYEYLKKNEQYAKSSNLITLFEDCNILKIDSTPDFYANDGKFNRLLQYSLFLRYENDRQNDCMCLAIKNNNSDRISRVSILLDNRYLLNPRFKSCNGNTALFSLGINGFTDICLSHFISLDIDLSDSLTWNSDEFIPYCRRFYNLVFNKHKYIYSLNQNLISDYYG